MLIVIMFKLNNSEMSLLLTLNVARLVFKPGITGNILGIVIYCMLCFIIKTVNEKHSNTIAPDIRF